MIHRTPLSPWNRARVSRVQSNRRHSGLSHRFATNSASVSTTSLMMWVIEKCSRDRKISTSPEMRMKYQDQVSKLAFGLRSSTGARRDGEDADGLVGLV